MTVSTPFLPTYASSHIWRRHSLPVVICHQVSTVRRRRKCWSALAAGRPSACWWALVGLRLERIYSVVWATGYQPRVPVCRLFAVYCRLVRNACWKAHLAPIAVPIKGNPLKHTFYLPEVIKNGEQGAADNIHQTFNTFVQPPSGDPLPYAGCPECIYLHWRWSNFLRNPNFNAGRPLIDAGSTQSVDLAIVNKGASAEVEDPTAPFIPRSLSATPVVWLVGTSTHLFDTFFLYDGFVFPAADLAVKILSAPNSVRPGQTLTYRVEVMNSGPAPLAPEVTLEVNMSGVAWSDIVATPSKGHCDPWSAFVQLCQLGTLARGEKVTVTIASQAVRAGQVVSNFIVQGLRPIRTSKTIQFRSRARSGRQLRKAGAPRTGVGEQILPTSFVTDLPLSALTLPVVLCN